jgi:hypothetical protein
MPRIAKPENAQQRERMRRYRERLRIDGRPEASAVDIAVAAAVAGYAGRAASDSSMDIAVLKGLLSDAVGQMVSTGYSRTEARKKLIRRIGRFSKTVPGGEGGPSL